MIITREVSNNPQKYLYLSKQHGALITIIICNIIALMASAEWHLFQIFTLLFGISAFHVMEYFTLLKREKSRLNNGFYFYVALMTLSLVSVIHYHNNLPTIASIGFPFAFIYLINQKFFKNTSVGHLSAFALLILAGLLTHNSQEPLSIIHLFSQLFIYFSCSVLLINWKIGKIKITWLTAFTFFATALLFFFHEPTYTIYFLLIIINTKLLFTYLFKSLILKTKMKTIGYLETLACLLLIYIL